MDSERFSLTVRLTDLATARAGIDRANACLAKIGVPVLDVTFEVAPVSALECEHPLTVEVTPHVGNRGFRAVLVCRCCGSFRRRVGPGWGSWGQWEASAPDVDDVRFPWPASPRVGEVRQYPEGAAFRLVEVAQ